MLVNPPRERPSASRPGLAADFLSFDPAPCVQLDRRDNLLGHISGGLVASSGGVLVSTDYPGVDPDRPLRTLGLVGVRRNSSRTSTHVPSPDQRRCRL